MEMQSSGAVQSNCCVICSECARCMERLADDKTCKALMGAAAQCIYLLYGLDLTEREDQWTDGFQVSTLVSHIWFSLEATHCSGDK